MTRPSCQHSVAADAVVRAESQPGSKVRLSFPSAHVQSDLADDRLGDEHINAIDARQIHSSDALQFIGKIEVGSVLVLFLLLFRRQVFPRWRRDRAGKTSQVLL